MATKKLGVSDLSFTKAAGEIRKALQELISTYEQRLNDMMASSGALCPAPDVAPSRAFFEATFGQFALADGYAALRCSELTMPALVSGDKEARTASSDAKKTLQQTFGKVYARTDLYQRLASAQDAAETAEEKRFVELTLGKFRHMGACLAEEAERVELGKLDDRVAALAFEIEQNINEDTTAVSLSPDELEGCDEAFVKSLPADPADAARRLCSVKAPVLVPIMRRAKAAATRKKMFEANVRKLVDKNGPLLDELLTKRDAAAKKLGFACHGDRILAPKMAASMQKAKDFCTDMLERVQPLRDSEHSKLQARKASDLGQEISGEDGKRFKTPLGWWDVTFYSDLLKREELSLDDERVKEFFALEETIDRILVIYSELLGLEFRKTKQLPTWHEDVLTFEVIEDGEVVGHLYLDQFPRDGKFGHQMIVPLAPSFVDGPGGVRCVPACANISNLSRPTEGRPALLRFSEMHTLFHEFGHAMHCLCTRTKYSMLSWAWPMVPWPGGVEQDFLEVPSMALEKFANEPTVLNRLAKHYSNAPDAPSLEDSTIQTIMALDRWMTGTMQSRYFAMALSDLLLHSQAPPYSFEGETGLDVPTFCSRVMAKYAQVETVDGDHYCASWYHLVIGYDAGYYGYLWSDVLAADLFDSMRKEPAGLLSKEVGRKLYAQLLGPCATVSGDALVRGFLGREPSLDAWCERNGVPVSSL